MKDFLKLCFKKNPVERPKAIHLMHHPWVLQKERNVPPPNTPSTPTTTINNNSSILQSYLKKTIKKDDNFTTLDNSNTQNHPEPKRKNSSVSMLSPINNISSPIAPFVRPVGHLHNMVKITFAEGMCIVEYKQLV